MSGTIQQPNLSSYPSATPDQGVPNPMAGFLKDPIGTMNAMTQLQVNQQTLKARQALGPIYQSAIDPQTGNFDINKFITGVSSNPDTAFLAGEVINQALQRQLTQKDILNKSLDAAQKNYEHFATIGAGLLAKAGPNGVVSYDDLIKQIGMSTATGFLDRDMGITIARNLPQDPKQLTDLVKQMTYGNKQALDAISTVRGSFHDINTGGHIVPTLESPIEGTATPAADFPQTPTVEQMNTLTEGQSASGAKTQVPRSAFPMVQPSPYSQGGGPQPVPNTGTRSDLTPTATTPAMDVQQFNENKGPVGEVYQSKLISDAQVAQTTDQQLSYQYGLIFNPDGTPKAPLGPGSAERTSVANFAQALGMAPDMADRVAGGDRSARIEFVKLMVTNAFNQLRQSLGGEGRLAVTEFQSMLEHGTPNPDMLPQAIKGMMTFMHDMAQLKLQEQKQFSAWTSAARQVNWTDPRTGQAISPNNWPTIWNEHLAQAGYSQKLLNDARTVKKTWLDQ